MAFLETPKFPDFLARGLTGGPEFNTDVIVTASGFEQRNAQWAQSRQRWDAASAVRTLTDWKALSDHFYAVRGRVDGFRLRDPADNAATASEGVLKPLHGTTQVGTAGYGYGVPTYQLAKRYTRGALTHDRDIRKPVAGVVFTRAGTSVSPTLDTTNGVVTFAADGVGTASSIGTGTTTTVVLPATLSLGSGDRMYLSGFAGADAATVNSLSHAITSRTGTGPYTFTLSVNTVGKTITLGTGLAYAYPQPDEALAWAGSFDVAVRFDTDHLQRTMIARVGGNEYAVQAASIPLVEVRT